MDDMTLSIPRQAGILVRREREAQGKTRAQLASQAHVSERLLASLELGDAPGIQLDKLLAVCTTLGIELVMRPTGKQVAAGSDVERSSRQPEPQDASSYDKVLREFMTLQGFDALAHDNIKPLEG